MRRCADGVSSLSQFSADFVSNVPHTVSMEPGLLEATECRCDSHLLYRLVGFNVRILRVNLTLI